MIIGCCVEYFSPIDSAVKTDGNNFLLKVVFLFLLKA